MNDYQSQLARIYSVDDALIQINDFEVKFLKAVQLLIEDYDALTILHQAMKHPTNSMYVMQLHQISSNPLPEWEFRGKVLSAMWDYLIRSESMQLSGHTFSTKMIPVVFF